MIFGKNKSLACFNPNPAARSRLFCFPCAGGGASMYRRWSQLLPGVEIWAVNYPGRESLHSQPYAMSLDEIVAPLVQQSELFSEKPFFLYGHSFGALVAFRTAFLLEQQGVAARALLVSARRAPFLAPERNYAHLPDAEFVRELDRFGGMPAAIRNDPEMLAFYLPIIRADLKLNDGIPTSAEDTIGAPVYVFSAILDHVATAEQLDAWRESTRARCEHRQMPGGHFFIQDDAEGFTGCLRAILAAHQADDDEELIAF